MRILYDYQAFTLQKYGGISRYYSELFLQIIQNKEFELVLNIFAAENENLKLLTPIQPFLDLKKINLKGKYWASNFLNKKFTTEYLKTGNFDIFHPTYYDDYFIKYIYKKPVIVTVYDLIHEKFGENYGSLKSDLPNVVNKRRILEVASKIIAISNTTKKDLMKYYNISSNKIEVVPLASTALPEIGCNFFPELNFDFTKKFLLYVGTRRMYKNFDFFLKSITSLLKHVNSILLVCAGGGSFTDDEKLLIKELGIDKYVIFQKIDNKILNFLYSNAVAFIFPSIYEGFGLPVLEAMNYRCPCVLSSCDAFLEVAGDAAVYFDPFRCDSIASAVQEIIQSPELRSKLIGLGEKRVKDFTWRKNYEYTKLIYESLI